MSKTKPSSSLTPFTDAWWKARALEHADKPNAQDLIDADNAKREEMMLKEGLPPAKPSPVVKPGLDG